jgi:hypothetical protein
MAEQYKVRVCSCLPAGIVGLNPAGVSCVLSGRCLCTMLVPLPGKFLLNLVTVGVY